MGLMEQLTARQIIVRLKDNGRKEVPTPRQLAQDSEPTKKSMC